MAFLVPSIPNFALMESGREDTARATFVGLKEVKERCAVRSALQFKSELEEELKGRIIKKFNDLGKGKKR